MLKGTTIALKSDLINYSSDQIGQPIQVEYSKSNREFQLPAKTGFNDPLQGRNPDFF